MGQDHNIGKLLSNILYIFDAKLLMHLTTTRPSNHLIVEVVWKMPDWISSRIDDLFTSLACHITREVFIRNKDDSLISQRFNNGNGIGRCAANVRLCFHIRIGVDVSHNRNTAKTSLKFAHVCSRNTSSKRTACLFRRYEHLLSRVEDFRGLGHKLHAAKYDDVFVGLCCFTTKFKRVANEIWN